MSLSPSGPQPRRLAGCFVISWTDRAGTSSGLHQGSHTFLFKFQRKHFLFCGFLMLLFIIRGWRWSTYGINLTYSLINIYRLKNSKKEGTKKKKKHFYLSIKGFSSILPETKSRFTTSEMKNHPHNIHTKVYQSKAFLFLLSTLSLLSLPLPHLHHHHLLHLTIHLDSLFTERGIICIFFFLFYRLTALIERSLFNDVYCLDW